jgi:EAL and modified HD-GYP domain-containing signal transduction protein
MDNFHENSEKNNPQIFIGRQPIFDSKLQVAAYELLFRSGNVNAYDGIDGEKATAQVINNSLMEIGLDDLVGNNLAFINFTKDSLMTDFAILLPADRVVVEILETVEVDEDLVLKVKGLVDEGYTVALDDFTFSDQWKPLIDIAKIIKFDVMQHNVEEIKSQIKKFEGKKLKLLAEKVETQDEYNKLKAEGFDYFQGYFFSKPEIVSHKALSADSISLLQLLSSIQRTDIETEELEKLISQDASLSYKLFRCVNSAAFGLKNKMSSIKQAIVYLGLQRLKNWVCLLAMTGNPNKSSELIQTGLVRAKMCELIADERDLPEKDSFFVVGLFSILDAVLDQSLNDILETMPLEDHLNRAMLEREGDMGNALDCSISCEQCKFEGIEFPNINKERLYEIYRDAMIWSRKSLSEIN